MKNIQLNQILEISKETEFYRHRLSDFSDKMIVDDALLTKKELQVFKDELLVSKYKNAKKAILEISRTSGSSGKFVEVYWKKDDLLRSNLCLWRKRREYYGITALDKFVSFHSLVYNGGQLLEPRDITSLNRKTNFSICKFDFSEDTLEYYCSKIKKFNPIWMFAQPSSILLFSDLLKRNNITPNSIMPNLKYIELTGEMLLKGEKEFLKDFYGVSVSNMYGCNEVNAIAYECPYGNMHVLEDNVHIQQNHDGEIIITSLQNTVMPIVGYNLGDIVMIEKNCGCRCGSNSLHSINSIIGRRSEYIDNINGKRVSSYELTYCIEYINSIMRNPILQFAAKVSNGVLILTLKINSDFEKWKESIDKELKDQIAEFLHIDANLVSILYVSDYLYNPCGKLSLIKGRKNS